LLKHQLVAHVGEVAVNQAGNVFLQWVDVDPEPTVVHVECRQDSNGVLPAVQAEVDSGAINQQRCQLRQ
jgi:hypothetical protein